VVKGSNPSESGSKTVVLIGINPKSCPIIKCQALCVCCAASWECCSVGLWAHAFAGLPRAPIRNSALGCSVPTLTVITWE
jgi:hypothetical protein